MSGRTTRILCVDDHAFLVDGLRARLEVERDLEFVGWIDQADDLVDEVRRTCADVVLLDIEMPGMDSFEALESLVQACPDVRVIMLSAYVRDRYIDAAYQAGAWGYLSKNDSPDAVINGIRAVIRGELASSPEVLQRSQPLPQTRHRRSPGDVKSRLELLTTRELQVLRLIAKGRTRVEIAEEICRSPMTVDNHRKSIMKKLDISDRVELARYAISEGLVEV